MRTTLARILKGLHEGYALKVFVDQSGRDPDTYHLVSWRFDLDGDEGYLMAQAVAGEHRRPFSHAAVDDLQIDGLIEWMPNTGTNALYALTPEGLAEAQRQHGPIVAEVLVKHEAGVERLRPADGEGPTVPSGEIAVPDDPDAAGTPTP